MITDSYVSLEFGTGALKITPAHDFNDFEVARRHNLPAIQVIDEGGNMTKEAGPKYVGMDRFVCREQIVKDLKKLGLLDKAGALPGAGGPLLPLQGHRRAPGLQTVVRGGQDPGRGGHRRGAGRPHQTHPGQLGQELLRLDEQYPGLVHLPPDLVGPPHPGLDLQAVAARSWSAGKTRRTARNAAAAELVQETDVLDTWFSSALWPFSTLGWPDQTPELKLFYPTRVLVTAFDILFFWVARMMMMGIHFMGEVPFREVYIHALVRDAEGHKMSKSKGNVVDPLDLMNEYGTDAFRFSLAAFAAMGRDVRLNEDRIAGYRNFANKVWNASRFTLMNLEDYSSAGFQPVAQASSLWTISP